MPNKHTDQWNLLLMKYWKVKQTDRKYRLGKMDSYGKFSPPFHSGHAQDEPPDLLKFLLENGDVVPKEKFPNSENIFWRKPSSYNGYHYRNIYWYFRDGIIGVYALHKDIYNLSVVLRLESFSPDV